MQSTASFHLKRGWRRLFLSHPCVILFAKRSADCRLAIQIERAWHANNGKQQWGYELSVSTQGLHLIVQNIVKEKLFSKLKFFDKRKHGSYSTKTNSVCSMLIKLGNILAVEDDHKWWDTMRSTVMRTHTDHRNNCIKAMQLCFWGTFTCCDTHEDCELCFLMLPQFLLQTIWGCRMSHPKLQCRRCVSQNIAWRI